MALLKWLVGGLAGGTIGGVIWILVSYYLNAEVGYIAIAIGILTGLGVRMFSRYDSTPPTKTQSILACLIAAVMVLVAKFMVVSLAVDRAAAEEQAVVRPVAEEQTSELSEDASRLQEFINGLPKIDVEESELPLRLARNEAQRREQDGEVLNWPNGQTLDSAETEADMPPEVMQWARDQIAEMSAEEVDAAIEREEELLNRFVDAMRQAAQSQIDAEKATENQDITTEPKALDKLTFFARFEIFMNSLGWLDLLWIVLAIGSAYKISGDDESNVPPATQ